MKTCHSHNTRATALFLLLVRLVVIVLLLVPATVRPLHAESAQPAQSAAEALELKVAQAPKTGKWRFPLPPLASVPKTAQTIECTIMTEMTDEGRKLPAPGWDKPVYYISHPIGQRDIGDLHAGTDKIKQQFPEKQAAAALASNGYRLADERHPPSQFLLFFWGMHNKITPAGDMNAGRKTDTSGTPGSPASPATDTSSGGDYIVNSEGILNLLSRAKIVGGAKFANEFAQAISVQMDWPAADTAADETNRPLVNFARRDETTAYLVGEIFNECHYLIVVAYDAEDFKRNIKTPLWMTHISTGRQGVSFEQKYFLPVMLNNAAYYFGRETAGPEWIRKRAIRTASVRPE